MQTVLLVVHLIACIALVIAVMLQRSEGGALGMGGGGTGGIISGRGAANVLVRTTMVLAAIFFVTSVSMTRLNAESARQPTGLERQIEEQGAEGVDPLRSSDPLGAPPASTTTPPPGTAPAPAPDPLAPAAPEATAAPPASAPVPAPSTTTPSSQPAPAQPDPLAPSDH